jgi:hypothetical protein
MIRTLASTVAVIGMLAVPAYAHSKHKHAAPIVLNKDVPDIEAAMVQGSLEDNMLQTVQLIALADMCNAIPDADAQNLLKTGMNIYTRGAAMSDDLKGAVKYALIDGTMTASEPHGCDVFIRDPAVTKSLEAAITASQKLTVIP